MNNPAKNQRSPTVQSQSAMTKSSSSPSLSFSLSLSLSILSFCEISIKPLTEHELK